MTDRKTLAALVERVEQATGPDLELDAAIMMAVYPRLGLSQNDHGQWISRTGVHTRVEPYTGSLDAALTLVPEGMAWTVLAISGADAATHSPSAVVTRQAGNAATPALALVAAALRAMMEDMGDD